MLGQGGTQTCLLCEPLAVYISVGCSLHTHHINKDIQLRSSFHLRGFSLFIGRAAVQTCWAGSRCRRRIAPRSTTGHPRRGRAGRPDLYPESPPRGKCSTASPRRFSSGTAAAAGYRCPQNPPPRSGWPW